MKDYIINLWNFFWDWYERTYVINITISLLLFLLQIFHLIWLFSEVIWDKFFGYSIFELTAFWKLIIILVDYTEIPALISVSFVYINELRKKINFKDLLYLSFLWIQLLHFFWITDEYVLETLKITPERSSVFTGLLAWIAILIDYLEVPVMVNVFRNVFRRFIKAITKNSSLLQIKEIFYEK